MTAVGWVGLGRLGAPCAAALAYHGGHEVFGYDVVGVGPDVYNWSGQPPVTLCDSIDAVVAATDDCVFVSVQTPHSPEYGGETVVPSEPRDFEYGFLVQAVSDVARSARAARKPITIVIVSTVLPGTFNAHLRPLLNEYTRAVYHPFFIAMGTVVSDFVSPEMTLFGVDHVDDADSVKELYASIHDAPAPTLSIPSAELAKVAYNTFISTKIVFANTMMELCDATGADVDEVTDALHHGTQRLLSPRYLRAGMGDGGACHPRDNVALSALAQRVGASFDLMGALTRAREAQTAWLADRVQRWHALTGLPITLLGVAYKANVALVDGSPGLLLKRFLDDRGLTVEVIDPVIAYGADATSLHAPALFVLTVMHDQFRDLKFPVGSVVIDPLGEVTRQANVTVVTPGRHPR